jgi:hypothetical protein
MGFIDIIIINDGKQKKEDVKADIVLDTDDINSLKLHGIGFMTGVAYGIEQKKPLLECLFDGAVGTLATIAYSVLFPKSAKKFKSQLFN